VQIGKVGKRHHHLFSFNPNGFVYSGSDLSPQKKKKHPPDEGFQRLGHIQTTDAQIITCSGRSK
jgi:hypothetical protein